MGMGMGMAAPERTGTAGVSELSETLILGMSRSGRPSRRSMITG